MTMIQNGHRWSMTIDGVFQGDCGVSGGRIAFRPLSPASVTKAHYAAVLNGRDVVLADVLPAGDGKSFTAQVLG